MAPERFNLETHRTILKFTMAMNNLTDFEVNDNKKNKNNEYQYTQKPKSQNPIDNTVRHTRVLFKRSEKIELDKQREELRLQALAADTPKEVDFEKIKKKETSRKYYAIRAARRQSKTVLDNKNLTNNQKLKAYNRHHKCKCGYKCNALQRREGKMHALCSHTTSKFIEKSEISCKNCGWKDTRKYRNTCGCDFYLCKRCTYSIFFYKYNAPEEEFSYFQYYDKHLNSGIIMHTYAPIDYNILPPVKEEETFDLAHDVKKMIVTKKKSRTDRANFFRELAGLDKLSYSSVARGRVTEIPAIILAKHDEKMKNENVEPCNKDEVPVHILECPEIMDKLISAVNVVEHGVENPPENKETNVRLPSRKKKFGKRIPLAEFIKSQEQGGVTSKVETPPEPNKETTVAETKGLIGRIIDNLKQGRDSLIDRVSGFKDCYVVKQLKEFFGGMIYILNVIRDTLSVTNILLVISVIKDFRDGGMNYLTGIMRLTHLIKILIEAEQDSVFKFKTYLRVIVEYANPNKINVLYNNNFGSLTTIIREYLLDEKLVEFKDDKYRIVDFDKLLTDLQNIPCMQKKFGIFTKMDLINDYKKEPADEIGRLISEEQGNENENPIFGYIKDIVGDLPKKFKNGCGLIINFCKQILPLLSVTKLSMDVGKMVNKAIDGVIEWWTGKIKDPKEWLLAQIYTTGNPINDLQVTYMLFRQKLYKPRTMADITVDGLRKRYYTQRVAAEQFVHDNLKYSTHFKQYLDSHNAGMAETGLPQDREFEPTVLLFQGAAGQGKSTVWPIVVAKALGLDNEDDPIRAVKETTYTWDISSEYMTGMLGKRVVLFDDFGQDRETNVEALSFMRLVTAAPFGINSASIVGPEIKGMCATPEIIVICTNDPEYATSKVFSAEALVRRLDICIELNKPFNPDSDTADFNIRRCMKYSKLVGKSLNLTGLVAMFTTVDIHKKKRFANLKKKVNKRIEAFSYKNKINLEDEKSITRNGLDKDSSFLEDFKKINTMDYTAMREYIKSEEQNGEDSMIAHLTNVLRTSFATGLTVSSSIFVLTAWTDSCNNIAGFNINTPMKSAFSIFKSTLRAAFITITACGALYMLVKYYNSHDSEESGTTKTAKARTPQLTLASTKQSNETLNPMVQKAIGTIRRREDGVTVNCLFIGGTYILTVKHFFQDYGTIEIIKDDVEIEITKSSWSQRKIVFPFKRARLIELEGASNIVTKEGTREDIILYELDSKVFNSEKRIIHHFWNAEYSLHNFEVRKLDYKSSVFYREVENDQYIVNTGKVLVDSIYTERIKGKDTYYHVAALAEYQERPMSCGSPIMVTHTMEKPLVGIHIASSLKGSLFHFVTRDSIEKALEGRTLITIEQAGNNISPNLDILPANSTIEFLGTVPSAHQNEKTDLRPSLIHGLFGEVMTEPAPLSPRDPRLNNNENAEYVKKNFYKIIFSGYNQSASFAYQELEEAVEYLKKKNKEIKTKSIVPQRILNLDETINGISYVPQNSTIELTTSPGYPYTIEHLSRAQLFTRDANYIEASPRIATDFYYSLDQIRKGIVPFLPFTLTIKDERLKKNKIYKDLKPRLFANGNIIHLLIMRRFFYSHVMAHYHYPDSYASLQIDRLSLDWHGLINYMREAGDYGFDADFKFWDRSICKTLICAAVEIELDYIKKQIMSDVGEIGYLTIIEMLSSPYLIFFGDLYRGFGLVTSGMYTTFMMNCDINEILRIAGFLAITRNISPLLSNLRAMEKHTRAKHGGDDTVQTVSEVVREIFNGITYSEWINDHGMKCTSSDKGEVSIAYRPLEELSFLKNTTGSLMGFYVPLTDMTSVYEMAYWVRLNKYNNDIHKATEDNINAALRCLYFYGPKIYNEFRDKIIDHNPNFSLYTYAENVRIWKTFYYFPGSHADYATRDDQDEKFLVYGKQKFTVSSNKVSRITEMSTITSTEQGEGLDKTNLNMKQEHPMVSAETIITSDLHDTTPEIQADGVGKGITTNVGTNVVEAQAPQLGTMRTAGMTHTSKNMRAELHCNDINWTLEKLEEKFTLVSSVNWSIDQSPETILVRLNLPTDILVTPAMKSPFDVTAYWRATTIKFRVVVKASAFYSGQLAIGFLPTLTKLTDTDVISFADSSRVFQLGGKHLTISDNQSVEFSVPFRHIYGFTEAPDDCIGQFIIFINNQLRTGSGNDNNVLITVYAAIVNSEFKVPEFVPPTFYRSPKFDVISQEQASTEIGSQQINIDDPIEKMPNIMMCAGTGLTGEPPVKQFMDHPIDLVQLRKRYRTLTRTTFASIGASSKAILNISVSDINKQVSGILGSAFMLNRGSTNLIIKLYVAPTSTMVDPGYRENINARIFLASNIIANGTDLEIAEAAGYFHGGSHYFTPHEPAHIMVPYMSPVFLTTFYDSNPDPFLISPAQLQIQVNNNNPVQEISYSLELIACLSDDFSAGIYMGTNSNMIATSFSEKTYEIIDSREQAGVLEFLDKAIDTTLPILQSLDGLASLLDAHPITYQAYPVRQKQLGYTIACDNVQYVERLGATNHNGLCASDQEAYGGKTKETDVYKLMTRTLGLYEKFTWTTSDAAGSLLKTYKVGPGAHGKTSFKTTPPVCVFSTDFYYWNGSLVFVIDVVASAMHKGQLIASFHPNLSVAPSSLQQATQQYFTSFDLNEGRATVALQVPYLKKTAYLPIDNVLPDKYPTKNHFNGILCLWVQNALRGTSTVANMVDVNVYLHAGADFKMEIYGSSLSSPTSLKKKELKIDQRVVKYE